MPINLPSSKPQANVASYLEEFRRLYLQQALSNAIHAVDLRAINRELDRLVPSQDLRKLASRGIRGGFVFSLPTLLAKKPNLLGYYRLLLGYSQKEYNVSNLNLAKAREKSPTTNRFYSLLDLSSRGTEEFADFRDRLVSIVGIASQPT